MNKQSYQQKFILLQAKHDQNNQLAHKVWSKIDLYLATGVLLFTDIFEIFRNKCLEYYKLDPNDKDGALCQDELKLELLRDVDMLLAFERDIREALGWQFKTLSKVKINI